MAAAQAANPDSSEPVALPVISDEELRDDVPALEGEDDDLLSAPLEPIVEFEQELDMGTAAPSQPTPGSDPELDRPLPPIDQFDVRQVDLAEPAPEGSEVEIRYRVVVEGLEEADAQSELDLLARFHELSALRQGDGKAANEAMLRARLEEDRELVRTLLESEGWYSATVSARLERPAEQGEEPLVAALSVAPGGRYRLGSITIDVGPGEPLDLARQSLLLEEGDPIIAEKVQVAEANIAVRLPEQGYPFVSVGQRDVLLDPDSFLGDYSLPVSTGPKSRFGSIRTKGDLAFGAEHVGVIARFDEGEIYDSRKVDDLRQALVATGLFRTVTVEPERTGMVGEDGTEEVTMLVTQDAGPPRTLAAAAGYETGQGFRAQADWTHRNLFPPEGALGATAVLGTSEQGASISFRRSNFGRRDRTFLATLEASRRTLDAFDALTGRIAARLSYDSTPIWRKPLTWAIGAEILGSYEEDFDFAAGERRKRRFLIGGINGQLGIDRTNDLLNPTRGFRAQILLQPEAALSDSFRPYVRSQIDGSAYHPVGDGIVLAARARLGSTFGIDRFDLAPSRRFYGGGGGSVRGFGYQQLGPKDPNGDPLGGLSLFEAAGEVRYRFGDYGVVAFIDAGQVYTSRIPDFRDIRFGVGIGGRLYTTFGPLRVDVATPIDRRDGESRFNLYVSIGQAF